MIYDDRIIRTIEVSIKTWIFNVKRNDGMTEMILQVTGYIMLVTAITANYQCS